MLCRPSFLPRTCVAHTLWYPGPLEPGFGALLALAVAIGAGFYVKEHRAKTAKA